ncbi:hypothetical protein KM043_008261 [Ampulex compressa]|nr:hypothetical protein KM043_008261 [Ampulex compressa]
MKAPDSRAQPSASLPLIPIILSGPIASRATVAWRIEPWKNKRAPLRGPQYGAFNGHPVEGLGVDSEDPGFGAVNPFARAKRSIIVESTGPVARRP